jgi:hypothetical protein
MVFGFMSLQYTNGNVSAGLHYEYGPMHRVRDSNQPWRDHDPPGDDASIDNTKMISHTIHPTAIVRQISEVVSFRFIPDGKE